MIPGCIFYIVLVVFVNLKHFSVFVLVSLLWTLNAFFSCWLSSKQETENNMPQETKDIVRLKECTILRATSL